jgi:hypothetical protein
MPVAARNDLGHEDDLRMLNTVSVSSTSQMGSCVADDKDSISQQLISARVGMKAYGCGCGCVGVCVYVWSRVRVRARVLYDWGVGMCVHVCLLQRYRGSFCIAVQFQKRS